MVSFLVVLRVGFHNNPIEPVRHSAAILGSYLTDAFIDAVRFLVHSSRPIWCTKQLTPFRANDLELCQERALSHERYLSSRFRRGQYLRDCSHELQSFHVYLFVGDQLHAQRLTSTPTPRPGGIIRGYQTNTFRKVKLAKAWNFDERLGCRNKVGMAKI